MADQLLPEIALIPYAVERDHWLRLLGEKLGVDVAVLREDMERLKKKIRNHKSEIINQVNGGGEKIVTEDDRLTKLIERLMVMVLRYNDLLLELSGESVDRILSTGRFGELYIAMKTEYTSNGKIDLEKLRGLVGPGDKENSIDILLMKGELDFSGVQINEAKIETQKLLVSILEEWKKKQRKAIQTRIENAERDGDKKIMGELMDEFNKI